MEESLNEYEAHESFTFKSPPRLRRSTFFERRESFVPQPVSENQVKINSSNTDLDDNRQAELSRYYEKLLLEKDQWKKEVNERKNKYKDLKQEYQRAVQTPSTSRMSYSALTKEDIEFIKGKPKISKLVESQSALHKSTHQVQSLYRRITELEKVILNDCEAKMNKITEHILENSTIMPNNVGE